MTSRRSSGSIPVESVIDPTKSQNENPLGWGESGPFHMTRSGRLERHRRRQSNHNVTVRPQDSRFELDGRRGGNPGRRPFHLELVETTGLRHHRTLEAGDEVVVLADARREVLAETGDVLAHRRE